MSVVAWDHAPPVDLALVCIPVVVCMVGSRRCSTTTGGTLWVLFGAAVTMLLAVWALGNEPKKMLTIWLALAVFGLVNAVWRDVRRWRGGRADRRASGVPGAVQAPSLRTRKPGR